MKNDVRYTVTTRSILVDAWTVTSTASFAKKGEALAAAQAALTEFGVCRARVAREVYEQAMTEWLVKGQVVFCWNEEAQVKEFNRPATREEVAAVMAAR